MAQTGYTPISIYYSATTTNVPTAGNLVAGELAINTADGRLFYKDSSGVVQVIGTKGGVGSSTTTQVLYNSSGLVVGSANLTFNGTTLTTANDASISGLTVGKGGGGATNNTAIGLNALPNTNTGTNNTAVGSTTMAVNTVTGAQNTTVGVISQRNLSSGASNSSLGYSSLYTNTTGAQNTAIGDSSLYNNTTASNNTAVGYQAGYNNTTGTQDVFIGRQAGYSSTGNSQTFVGDQAGYSVTSGSNNTFVGQYAGQAATTGSYNAFFGQGAGYLVTTGGKNTIIGSYNGNQSGLDIRTASNYIVLSDGDGVWKMYFTNTGAPYLGAVPSGVNATLQWNSGTGAVTYLVSSAKYKTNIQDTKYGLADVLKMRAVTFNHISDNTPDIGVIAEEMVDIVPEVVGLKDGEPDYVGYERLSSIFIKAIQELNAKIEAQALEIAQLKGN